MKAQDNSRGWPEGWLVAAAAAVLAGAMARLVGDLGLFAVLVIGIFVLLVFGVLLGLFWGGPIAQPHVAGGGHSAHGHGHGNDHGPAVSTPMAAPTALPSPVVASVDPVAPVAVQAFGRDGALMAEPMPAPVAPQAVMAPAEAPVVMASSTADDADLDDPEGDLDDGDADRPANAPRRTREERIAARAAKAARQAARAARAEEVAPMVPAAVMAAEMAPAEMTAPMAAAAAMSDPAMNNGVRPQGLSAPRGGMADRLQTIEGIGPVLEKLCHDLGIYHFDQIAGWGVAEIAWMDGNLKGFKGRVSRDKWVRQAALIGEVGVDEFLRRAKSNDY